MTFNLAAIRPEVAKPALLMSSFEMASAILNICADAKAKQPTVLDVRSVIDVYDYMVIVNARSDRAAQGIAHKLLNSFAELGIDASSVEGLEEGQWVLLDFSDVVVHIFYEPLRERYNIEGLWFRAPRLQIHEDARSGELRLCAPVQQRELRLGQSSIAKH